MKLNRTSGAVIAGAAALLVISATAPLAPAAADYKVKCFGLNSCKGHGQCKSLGNSCQGQNSCKGQGFLMMNKGTCLAKGGTLTHG
jgi:uncharacterized membrane protein